MVDLAAVTVALDAATSAVGLIDKIWDQVERFMSSSPEAAVPNQHKQTN